MEQPSGEGVTGAARWTPRDIASGAFCLVFLLTMIAIPLWQLRISFGTRCVGRFGWQMYARDHIQPKFEGVAKDGTTTVLQSRYRMRTWWGDFGFRQALVRDLCAQSPDTVRIVASKSYMPDFREDYSCR